MYQNFKFIGLNHLFFHTFVNDFHILIDTPLNSVKDANVGLRTKQRKKKVGAHSLTRNTSGVGRRAGALRWD